MKSLTSFLRTRKRLILNDLQRSFHVIHNPLNFSTTPEAAGVFTFRTDVTTEKKLITIFRHQRTPKEVCQGDATKLFATL